MGSTPRRFSVRLPIADASRLERLEAGLGRPASAVIRLGLAHLDGDAPASWKVPPELRTRLETIAHAVDRVGVNVNQMCRLAHIDGLDAAHLTDVHSELVALVAELREKVVV